MPMWAKILIPVAAVLVLLVTIPVVSYISNHNYAVSAEAGIKAQWENNENILAQYSLRVMEAAQVPDMMKDDLTDVLTAAMQGRYGEDGSQATFQWIQENYPGQVDASLYTNIQNLIESGRKDFEAGQTMLVDRKRSYETAMGSFWSGMWIRVAGFPKINLADYEIISSDHARDAFETGVDKGLQLRPQ